MSNPIQTTFEWHYVGHYGELGPLSLEQMIELVRDSVVERETFVWKSGMMDWVRASQVNELMGAFRQYQSMLPPPTPSNPPPVPPASSSSNYTPASPSAKNPVPNPYSPDLGMTASSAYEPTGLVEGFTPYGADSGPGSGYSGGNYPRPAYGNYPMASLPRSDKSKIAAGILNIIFPGVGRMYLGYVSQGLLQLLTCLCFGLGAVWSLIDGIIILTGGVKLDGYNRVLGD